MTLNEELTKLYLLKQKAESTTFSNDKRWIEFKFNNVNDESSEINSMGFVYIHRRGNTYAIDRDKIPGLFLDQEHFFECCDSSLFNSDIGIFEYKDNGCIIFNHETEVSTFLTGSVCDENFIKDSKYYCLFLDSFKGIKNKWVYLNEAFKEIILTSPEYGTFRISYPLHPRPNSTNYDFENKWKLFNSFLVKKKSEELEIIFWQQIIEFLKDINPNERFEVLLNKIDVIIESSQRNYQLFLSKFSFEKLKKDFRKDQEQYFNSIRELQNQTLNKVVSIPISISATALAIYNLKAVPVFAYLVLMGYILYSLFTSYLLRLLASDCKESQISFANNIELLRHNSPLTKEDLNWEIGKINSKFTQVLTTIRLVLLTLLILAILSAFFTFTFLGLSTQIIILFLIIIFVLHWSTSLFEK